MRKIDWNKALTDEDIVWLTQAGIFGMKEKIAAHQARFAKVEGEDPETEVEEESEEDDETTSPEDQGDEDDYPDWKLSELRTEANTRKEFSLTTAEIKTSTKSGLVKALRAWDKANPDAA